MAAGRIEADTVDGAIMRIVVLQEPVAPDVENLDLLVHFLLLWLLFVVALDLLLYDLVLVLLQLVLIPAMTGT